MNSKRSLSVFQFVSASFIFCGALATGCVTDDQVASDTQELTAQTAVINQMGSSAVQVQREFRLEASGNGLAMIGDGWKQSSPGIWSKGSTRVIVGAEGHKAEIAVQTAELEDLRKRQAAEPTLATELEQREAQLQMLKGAAAKAGQLPEVAPLLSCGFGFINGPSSPWVGIVGAIGGAQVSCSGGCQQFTIAAQACTNFGCGPVYSASNLVCSTPWTFGAWTSGSQGASCASAASITPPGVTATSYFACN